MSYNAQGQEVHSYKAISHFGDTENYHNLNILDTVQIGDEAYMLLQTNHDRYLACYDLVQHTFSLRNWTDLIRNLCK